MSNICFSCTNISSSAVSSQESRWLCTMAAMPSASVPALTAQELYGAELGAEACQLNMITTVCCLFTVPIVSLFL